MTTSATPPLTPGSVTVDFPGRDFLFATREHQEWQVQVIGCSGLTQEIQRRLAEQKDLTRWAMPAGHSHAELLIRELILRARGEWELPYKEEELCHCRSIPTNVVDQAIVAGAHDCKQVSADTTASTSCGTCRPYVQQMIDYRLSAKVG